MNHKNPQQTSSTTHSIHEIERKFLVKKIPASLEVLPHQDMVQGYISVTDDGTEVRLRRLGNRYYQTVKRGNGLERDEREIELSLEQFAMLWPLTQKRRLEKTRYEIAHLHHTIQLDVYRGPLAGLVVAEVEFQSRESSLAFVRPDWFAREITEDISFKNRELACQGLPVGDD